MTSTATKPAKPTAKKAPAKAAPIKAAPKPATPAKATPKAAPKSEPVEPAEPKTLVGALAAGKVTLIKVRGNGTKRSLPYLPVGSEGRK